QDGEPAGLVLGPAVADVDADVVLGRKLPTELAIDLVVAGSAGQKHAARLVTETAEVQRGRRPHLVGYAVTAPGARAKGRARPATLHRTAPRTRRGRRRS